MLRAAAQRATAQAAAAAAASAARAAPARAAAAPSLPSLLLHARGFAKVRRLRVRRHMQGPPPPQVVWCWWSRAGRCDGAL